MNLGEKLRGWRRDDRGWPRYMPGGRIRTSTAGLIVAFIALSWVAQVFEPPARPPAAPESSVVPPGFVPDPNYTWVPRTNVRTREPEVTTTTPTTTTTTTTTTPTTTGTTEPPLPGVTTTPTGPEGPTTTVIDPDGVGPGSPETFTQAPTETPAQVPTLAPTAPVPPTTVPPQ
ncbi:hypothetical protein [Mycolicibacterium hippocampi]|uniref:Proline rich protein n=1 Tax=Mycolicibacterium hippocampi TaxID=659824 RepID=A0A7I9ZMW1_9MYCO|nr:hypothetical protein [Mycolicibacterium hippocampi]GFH02179.1 hypothetical protein MHIP_26620 [Mycolicibacterium hippocampi]